MPFLVSGGVVEDWDSCPLILHPLSFPILFKIATESGCSNCWIVSVVTAATYYWTAAFY